MNVWNLIILTLLLSTPRIGLALDFHAADVAGDLRVVGLLGGVNGGQNFKGIVVLRRVGSSRSMFLKLQDGIPGLTGIKVAKVEKKTVFISGRGDSEARLAWSDFGDSGRAYSYTPPPEYGDEEELRAPMRRTPPPRGGPRKNVREPSEALNRQLPEQSPPIYEQNPEFGVVYPPNGNRYDKEYDEYYDGQTPIEYPADVEGLLDSDVMPGEQGDPRGARLN